MNKLLASLTVVAAALLPLATSARPVLSISPANQGVAVGGNVTVDINISGLSSIGEIASAFDLNVLFSSSVLSGTSVVFNSAIFGGLANIDTSFTFNAGNTGAILNSFASDAALAALQTADPFRLMSMTFSALAVGNTFLTFGPSLDFDRAVIGRNGVQLDLDYTRACVSVGASAPGTGCANVPVPEPASFALVGLALLAGGAASRKALRRLTA